MRADAGKIFVGQTDVTDISGRELEDLRTRFGVLFQGAALFDSMTVFENVALPLRERTKKSEEEVRKQVMDTLTQLELAGHEEKYPAQLSGGMQKRVGLARALQLNPEIMLFDEPTTGLDPVLAAVIDELIVDLSTRSHATSIVVTHELTSAFRVATRMAMLFRGRIIEEDRPERFRHPANPVVEQFIEGRTKGPIR